MIGIYCHHTSRFARNTGIQRCLRATARALAELGEPIVPLVWSPEANGLALAPADALRHLALWFGPCFEHWRHGPLPPGSWVVVVELISGPHQPPQAWLRRLADRQGWRLAGVFHDAIPLAWGEPAAGYHARYMDGLADYDLVLATSATTEAELRRHWAGRTIRARLERLALAAEIQASPRLQPASAVVAPPLRLLCVGSLEPRKNHRALLLALAWLEAQGHRQLQLQLVGWANDSSVVAMVQRAQFLGLPVAWDPAADDAALIDHYHSCHCSIYPSLEEGFGLPVLESLWLGRPCMVGDAPALQEQAAAGGCWVVNSRDWRELAEVLVRLQENPHYLHTLARQLVQRPLRTWRDYAEGLLAAMRTTPTESI